MVSVKDDLFSNKYVHRRNQDGETLLTLLINAAYQYDVPKKILEILIRNGADVNAADNEGMTPLMWAVLGNQKEKAPFLLKNGAFVNALDKKDNSPLLIALYGRNIHIVKLLLENRAAVNHDK